MNAEVDRNLICGMKESIDIIRNYAGSVKQMGPYVESLLEELGSGEFHEPARGKTSVEFSPARLSNIGDGIYITGLKIMDLEHLQEKDCKAKDGACLKQMGNRIDKFVLERNRKTGLWVPLHQYEDFCAGIVSLSEAYKVKDDVLKKLLPYQPSD